MTRRLTNAILLVFCCLALSNNVFAQLKDNIELNVFGAGSVYTRNHYEIGYPQSPNPIPGEVKFHPHARFGTRLGVYTRGRWGEEFFYSFEPNGMTISQGGPTPTKTDIRIRMHNYGINALYYLQETESHAFQPFVSAGIGGVLYEIRQESSAFLRDPARGNLEDMNNANEVAFNYGFGFKVHPGGWFGLRFDIRDFMVRQPSFGLARQSNDPNATVFPATGILNNGELSLGVTFYFGKR
jgi:opacity protein-like surface antigen